MNLEQGFTGTKGAMLPYDPDRKRNCEVPIREIEVDVLNDFGFSWKLPTQTEFEPDWTQLQYQNIYKSPDYVASKFPSGFSNLPGFDKIMKNIANKMRTPLEEITYLSNSACGRGHRGDFISLNNIIDEERDNSNISQFKNSQ